MSGIHWTSLLKEKDHILQGVLDDYSDDKLIKSGYMFAGYLQDDKSLGIRTVIIHYHTTNDRARFDELQNLEGYAKILGLNENDIKYLSTIIDRGEVVKMSKPLVIQETHVTCSCLADIFVGVDEKGSMKEYGKVYKENHE